VFTFAALLNQMSGFASPQEGAERPQGIADKAKASEHDNG
jgi:hypothetical protein